MDLKDIQLKRFLKNIRTGENIKIDKAYEKDINAFYNDVLKEKHSEISGLAIHYKNERHVYISDSLSEYDEAFTILHELGHHILGHIDYSRTVSNGHDFEKQADLFACIIIAINTCKKYGLI